MKQTGWLLLLMAILVNACAPNNVHVQKDWEKYFTENKVEGTFMLFDNGQGSFKVYNIDRAKERFLPASTFKIFNSLVGLETGVLKDSGAIIPWNGIHHEDMDSVWDRDLNMAQAFRLSSVPYFQEVARRITKPVMQQWLDSVKYGNMKISRIDTFWLDNSLRISADEELGFVKKLYFDDLPFHKLTMQRVREIMLMEKTPKYELRYKTGWGQEGKKQIGWVVGWIEENGHPAFFALNIGFEDQNIDMEKVRMNITKSILKDAGYLEGRK